MHVDKDGIVSLLGENVEFCEISLTAFESAASVLSLRTAFIHSFYKGRGAKHEHLTNSLSS